MKKLTWPAWFNSPDGKTNAIFEAAEDVPKGWTSGAEKQTTGGKPATKEPVKEVTTATPADSTNTELDVYGHPWSADFHASSKGKTAQGLWRMKVGIARPKPAPGYPLDL